MLRQYGTGRHRYERIGARDIAVGTIPIGTIFRHQATRHARPRRYIVAGWLTRAYATCNRQGPPFVFLARGGHLAIVRALHDGREAMLADHVIQRALDD
jgi:hypothetical protein